MGRWLQERSPGIPFVSPDRGGDALDVEAMDLSDALPELAQILDDGVATLHDGFLAGNSSGVQMIDLAMRVVAATRA